MLHRGKKAFEVQYFTASQGKTGIFTGEEAFVYIIHGHTETLKWGLLNIIFTPFSYLTFTTNTTH